MIAGNTIRRILEDPEFFANLIEVPVQLVINIRNIWIAIRSNLNLCPNKFHKLCQETKKIYKEAVDWNEMNSAQHKVLDHAYLVIRALPNGLFLGQLDESPSESNNKDLKDTEVHHARQDSHFNRMTDIVFRQLDRSDPVNLDNIMKRRVTHKRRNRKAIPIEVLRLTKEWKESDEEPANEEAEEEDDSDSDNDDEELDALEDAMIQEATNVLEQLDEEQEDDFGLLDDLLSAMR